MRSSAQLQQDLTRLQGSANQLQDQMGLWHQRVAELQADRAGLEDFRLQVQSERSYFEQALARKRQAAQRASQVVHSGIAVGMAAMLAGRYGHSFESGVQANYNGVFRQIHQALGRIEDELRQLNANIASAEREASNLKWRIASALSDYESALAREQEQTGRARQR